MSKTTIALPLTAALLAAAGPTDDQVSLRLAPTAGTVSTHTVQIQRAVEGGDMAVVMNGTEVPAQFLPKLNFEFNTSTAATVTDHFLPESIAAENGATGPWRKRTLEDLSETFDMSLSLDADTTDVTTEASSDLDGQPFLIGQDEDGEVIARWADPDSEAPDRLLDHVRPALHLEGLLPAEPIATGSTWEASASALAGVLNLGETLPWTWSESAAGNAPTPGATTLEGDLDLRAVDVRTEDGVVFCTISVDGEVIETSTRASDLSQVPVADGNATETTTTTYTVEGELVWNVTAGHMATFQLDGEGEGEQATVKDAGQPGPDYSSTTQHTAELNVQVK